MLEAWSTRRSGELSQDLGTKSPNGFGDRLGLKTTSTVVAFVGTWPTPYSADDAKRSSQVLGMSASRHPRNMLWAMFRQSGHTAQHRGLGSGDVWRSRVLGQQEAAYCGSQNHGCRISGMQRGGPGGAFTGHSGTRGDSLVVIRLSTGWARSDTV
jgi:hypothetical protein